MHIMVMTKKLVELLLLVMMDISLSIFLKWLLQMIFKKYTLDMKV